MCQPLGQWSMLWPLQPWHWRLCDRTWFEHLRDRGATFVQSPQKHKASSSSWCCPEMFIYSCQYRRFEKFKKNITDSQKQTHKQLQSKQKHTHTHTHTHTHRHTPTPMHTHTHTHMRTRTHTHACTDSQRHKMINKIYSYNDLRLVVTLQVNPECTKTWSRPESKVAQQCYQSSSQTSRQTDKAIENKASHYHSTITVNIHPKIQAYKTKQGIVSLAINLPWS